MFSNGNSCGEQNVIFNISKHALSKRSCNNEPERLAKWKCKNSKETKPKIEKEERRRRRGEKGKGELCICFTP
jgi:hypothetical protein